MKRVALTLVAIAVICCASLVHAQDATNLYMFGVSAAPGATPAVAGSAFYARSLNSNGTYAIAAMDAVPSSYRPFTVTSNVGAGVAQRVLSIDGIGIFMPTSAGISWNGNNTGWAWSTGVGVPFKLKLKAKDGAWYAMPTARWSRSNVSNGSGYQVIAGVYFGWGK